MIIRCQRLVYGNQCKKNAVQNTKYCEKHQRLFKNQTFAIGYRKFEGKRITNYQEYIDSAEWKERSKALRKKLGNHCVLCHRTGKTHVHHNTYVRLGHERAEDLTLLCENCHKLFHQFYEYAGNVGYFIPKPELINLLRKLKNKNAN